MDAWPPHLPIPPPSHSTDCITSCSRSQPVRLRGMRGELDNGRRGRRGLIEGTMPCEQPSLNAMFVLDVPYIQIQMRTCIQADLQAYTMIHCRLRCMQVGGSCMDGVGGWSWRLSFRRCSSLTGTESIPAPATPTRCPAHCPPLHPFHVPLLGSCTYLLYSHVLLLHNLVNSPPHVSSTYCPVTVPSTLLLSRIQFSMESHSHSLCLLMRPTRNLFTIHAC